MTTIAKRLKRAREEAGFANATEAARHFGWNENTYRSTENGTRPPGRGPAMQYATGFGVALDWLLSGRGAMRPGGKHQYRQVPYFFLSDIKARTKLELRRFLVSAQPRGFFVMPEDDRVSPSSSIAVTINDRSMVDPNGSYLSLYPDDKAVFDAVRPMPPDSIVLANHGGTLLVRRLRVIRGEGDNALVELLPLNENFPTVETTGDRILGVLVGQWRAR